MKGSVGRLVASILVVSVTIAAHPAAIAHSAGSAAAAPDPNTYPVVLSGDFTGDGVHDLFFHSPSSAPDVLYDLNDTRFGDPPLDIWTYDVRGSYRPVVGRFTGGEFVDDILWYAPGAKADVIWAFDGCFDHCDQRPPYHRLPVTINGTYTPVAGKFFGYPGDGDDVLWYGRGSIPDSIWDFSADCDGCPATWTTRPITVNGASYQPVAGNFVGPVVIDDVFWYNPTGPETIWAFGVPFEYRYTSINHPSIQVRGSSYRLAVADLFADWFEDIVFVGPGAAQDSVWDFYDDAVYKLATPEPLTGQYTAVTGVREPSYDQYPEDFFVYDPTATAGRYFDIDFDNDPSSFVYTRYDFDPAPVTDLGIPTAAAATAPNQRPWWIHVPRR